MTQNAIQEAPQPDFRATELDPELLCTPFAVQTNWHVITGAPSCGKTTLIDGLAAEGFRTVAETARQYLESEVAKGHTIAEIRADWAFFQRHLTDLQRRTEDGLSARDVLFLDRGLPDTLAFCRLAGLNPNEFLAECFRHRYASVFLLDPLPFQLDGMRDLLLYDQSGRRHLDPLPFPLDGMRMENDAVIADYLDEWHARDYRALGYEVLRVPVLPPQERLAFVLDRLSERGLI